MGGDFRSRPWLRPKQFETKGRSKAVKNLSLRTKTVLEDAILSNRIRFDTNKSLEVPVVLLSMV